MVDVWEVAIPPLTGEKKRRAYVYLPDDYDESEERRYPVLYMFDGHNLFPTAKLPTARAGGFPTI